MSTDRILLAHGDGGQLMADLIAQVFVARLGAGDPPGDDAAQFAASGRLAFTTDAFVVDPIFFPGGDIGRLAVCGTVNDLATAGARPLALSASFIIEEGFPIAALERVADSMAHTADEAAVRIVTGDTKVVPRGKADKLYISTSGVGEIAEEICISGANVQVGDVVIVTGPVGDHGLAVLSQREGLEFESGIVSDCAPLAEMVQALLCATPATHSLRDPTRGGLAAALNEIARQSQVEIEIVEADVPVRPSVAAACELLGLDPLYAANEGKMAVFVSPDQAQRALQALSEHKYGRDATMIGRATRRCPGRVLLKTALGTHRILDRHVGEQMPRIC